jgi:hypothetical protein
MKDIVKNSRLFLLAMAGFCQGEVMGQIRNVGVVYQQSLMENGVSKMGVEYNSTNYLYNLGIGYLAGKNEDIEVRQMRMHTEFHLLQFHHGYLRYRFVPYVGVQIERSEIDKMQGDEIKSVKMNTISMKSGLKLSADRYIVSADYQWKQRMLNVRVTYAIWVVNPCVRKRIDEFGYSGGW